MARSVPDIGALRQARERFLSEGELGSVDVAVRAPIRYSWRRSLAGAVPREPEFRFESEIDLDSRLCRAARPVFDRLVERLDGTGTSLFLANERSVLLRRWADTPDLRRRLDRACSVPGAVLDEQQVGTNGVGSVAETGVALSVTGPEHWAEGYQDLACSGAPIRNRVTGRIEGVLTATCSRVDEHPAVLALVSEGASDIERELTVTASREERALLELFLTATRRSNRAILVASSRLLITTPAAARVLGRIDESLLWEHIAESEGSGNAASIVLASDDRIVDIRVRPQRDSGRTLLGVVVEFREREPGDLGDIRDQRARTEPALTGWVARSAAGRAAARVVVAAVRARRGTLVSGEPGTGKLHLLRCALLADGRAPAIFDAALEAIDGMPAFVAAVRAALGDPARPVVLRHAELMSASAARALAALVELAPTRTPVAGVTVCGEIEALPPPVRALIRQVAPVTFELPPLRHRSDDMRELVAQFSAGRRRWTSAPLQVVLRQAWPDNVRQLRQLVEAVCGSGRRGDVVLEDLPSELRARSARRRMTRMEEVGLSALFAALQEAGGNKARAAEILGVSRSTVYRKLASSGLDLDQRAY